MISHKHKFVFIHIPRVGGTSFELSVGVNMWKDHPNEKHLCTKETIKKYGKDTWDDYFTFSMVRNPYSRIISLWKSGYYCKAETLYEFLLKFKPAEHESNKIRFIDILNPKPDFVGRTENYEEDCKYICQKTGLDSLPILHVEKTEHTQYSYYYSKKTKAIVDYLFGKDVKEFDYCYDDKSKNNVKYSFLGYYIHILLFKISRCLTAYGVYR